ncbi:MAG: beta-ketoacyl-[acyl-carrier-protein] synthase II, partial [Candidatus Aminicenantes bacterium]|nr:beta-ketoacyl-[acyl-carrier-protein] synthase II [Candidatus Aminicenantes bacterium]
MAESRVVVTGLGAVTPVGTGVDRFWEGLVAGRNGVGRVSHFDPAAFSSQMAAEVKDFDPEKWIDRKSASRMDRFTQFAVAAAEMALSDAGLAPGRFPPERTGVIIGSGIGGSASIEQGNAQMAAKGP